METRLVKNVSASLVGNCPNCWPNLFMKTSQPLKKTGWFTVIVKRFSVHKLDVLHYQTFRHSFFLYRNPNKNHENSATQHRLFMSASVHRSWFYKAIPLRHNPSPTGNMANNPANCNPNIYDKTVKFTSLQACVCRNCSVYSFNLNLRGFFYTKSLTLSTWFGAKIIIPSWRNNMLS